MSMRRLSKKEEKNLKYAGRNFGIKFRTFKNKLYPSMYFSFSLYDIKDYYS